MENYFSQIQDYLDGLLSEEERQLFEKELLINKELREEIALQRKINDTIRNRIEAQEGLTALKSTLDKTQKQYFESASSADDVIVPSRNVFSFKKWGIAIGVAACLLISLNFLGIFNTGLHNVPSLPAEVTRNSDDQVLLTNAITSFNQKDFKKSIPLFSELTSAHPTSTRFQYYLALSYIGDKRWSDAMDTAIPVADGTSLYKDDAAYFTALAAWELNNESLALNYAKKVSKSSEYYGKAQRIIKKIQ